MGVMPAGALKVDEVVELSPGGVHRPLAMDGEMDITPMIDVTFLLLIFFLVASCIDSQSNIELPDARYGTAVAAQNAVILTMTRGPGDLAQIYKGDGAVPANLLTANDLSGQEREIVAYLQAGLRGATPKQNVIIKAEPEVKHREVARVARAVSQIPGVPLQVAVYEVP